MSKFRVSPLSKIEIRTYTKQIRELLEYNPTDYVNAPKLFDRLSILFANSGLKFDYKIMPDDHEIFVDKEEAFTDMSSGIIYIKTSVMEQACRRSYRRGSFTLIHELGHYLLHYLQNNVRLESVEDDVTVPPFRDPEWQANTFASEFLMPYEDCIRLGADEIRKTYHVSRQAAEVRYRKVHDEEQEKAIDKRMSELYEKEFGSKR